MLAISWLPIQPSTSVGSCTLAAIPHTTSRTGFHIFSVHSPIKLQSRTTVRKERHQAHTANAHSPTQRVPVVPGPCNAPLFCQQNQNIHHWRPLSPLRVQQRPPLQATAHIRPPICQSDESSKTHHPHVPIRGFKNGRVSTLLGTPNQCNAQQHHTRVTQQLRTVNFNDFCAVTQPPPPVGGARPVPSMALFFLWQKS